MKRAFLAMAVLAAAAFAAVGFKAQGADAQTPFVNPNGPYAGVVGIPVQFVGSAGFGVHYFWSFGDGTTASGQAVAKTYAAPGVYPVTLTVVNSLGQTLSSTTTASITGTIAYNQPFVVYNANSRVLASASPTTLCKYVPLNGGAAYQCGYGYYASNGYVLNQYISANCYSLWFALGYIPACAYYR